MDLTKLESDLRQAIEIGLAAAACVPDDGSCNFDTLFLSVPRASKKLDDALERAGARPDRHRSRMWGGYFVRFSAPGQAAKRTAAVVAARDELLRRGWACFSVFYQLD